MLHIQKKTLYTIYKRRHCSQYTKEGTVHNIQKKTLYTIYKKRHCTNMNSLIELICLFCVSNLYGTFCSD